MITTIDSYFVLFFYLYSCPIQLFFISFSLSPSLIHILCLSPVVSLCLFGRFIILHVLFDNWMNLSWLKTRFYLFITLWFVQWVSKHSLILHTHTHLIIKKNPTYWTNNFIWLIIVVSTKWRRMRKKNWDIFLLWCSFLVMPRVEHPSPNLFLRVCHSKLLKIMRLIFFLVKANNKDDYANSWQRW